MKGTPENLWDIFLLYSCRKSIHFFNLTERDKQYILFALLFFSCSIQRGKKVEEDYWYTCSWNISIDNRRPQDILNISLEVFEVKENLFCLLDSIVEEAEKCPKYKISGIEFMFWSFLSGYNRDTVICIENISIDCINLKNKDGIFFHKGYPFYFSGFFFQEFFETTEEITTRRSVEMKIKVKNKEYVVNNDTDSDRGSYWYYLYKNGNLKISSFDNCGNMWYDKSINSQPND